MTELEKAFEAAKARVMELKEKPSNDKLLELYSLNKQATIGDINIDKPVMFDFVAQAKYNAWEKKKGMSKEAAMEAYISFVDQLFKE
ncbi:MAG: acyl-CoA-binding protein [Bacteroidetes bacterium]|nr:acyl-CoA-binding protein [Bacteroidota bacterium]